MQPPPPVPGVLRATGPKRLGRVRGQLSGEDRAEVAPEWAPQVPALGCCQARKPGELAVTEGAAWRCTGPRSPEQGSDLRGFVKTYLGLDYF